MDGSKSGPPSTSAWAVIWSGELGYIQAHGIAVGFLLDEDFSESSLRHEFVTISSRRKGPIDCWDLLLFQLSLLGKDGGGKLKYARCHPFYCFLLEVVPKCL